MKDPKCALKNNDTHYVISFAYSECDTHITKFDDYDIVQNEIFVTADRSHEDGLVFGFDFSMPLECKVPNEPFRTVSNSFKVVPNRQLVERNLDTPLPTFELREYTDAQYQNRSEQSSIEVVPNAELYMEVAAVNGSSRGRGVKVQHCVATPTVNSSESRHVLIQNGCNKTTAVSLQPNPDAETFRFSVRAFYFKSSDKDQSQVYIHCDVTTGHNPKTCSESNTSHRKKRSVTGLIRKLSSGPHILTSGG